MTTATRLTSVFALLLRPELASATSVLAVQSQSRPENYFWAGVLIALVPVLIFGTLGGILLYVYLREARSSGRKEVPRADP